MACEVAGTAANVDDPDSRFELEEVLVKLFEPRFGFKVFPVKFSTTSKILHRGVCR